MEKRNNSQNNLVVGMLAGFATYLAFDFYRDKNKRKELVADLKEFGNEIQPYVSELKSSALSNKDVKQALIDVDKTFGTDLTGYIMGAEKSEWAPEKKKTTTISIRKFFKRK